MAALIFLTGFVSVLVSCGEDSRLNGNWIGTYTDTSALVSMLTLSILSGTTLSEADYAKYIDVYDIELNLEQNDSVVMGNIKVGSKTFPIKNATFIEETLSFSYEEEKFFSSREVVNVSGTLIDNSTLAGDWGKSGTWEAVKN